jgi:hypothetical protein
METWNSLRFVDMVSLLEITHIYNDSKYLFKKTHLILTIEGNQDNYVAII